MQASIIRKSNMAPASVGPPSSKDSYLNVPRIMAAVEITNADAIHPGYGFLAENADFAEVCLEYGIKFIGPTPSQIRKMGDKITAKETMIKAGKLVADPTSSKFILTEDTLFSTPSGASSFVLGRSSNGYTAWVDSKGHQLDQYRNRNK